MYEQLDFLSLVAPAPLSEPIMAVGSTTAAKCMEHKADSVTERKPDANMTSKKTVQNTQEEPVMEEIPAKPTVRKRKTATTDNAGVKTNKKNDQKVAEEKAADNANVPAPKKRRARTVKAEDVSVETKKAKTTRASRKNDDTVTEDTPARPVTKTRKTSGKIVGDAAKGSAKEMATDTAASKQKRTGAVEAGENPVETKIVKSVRVSKKPVDAKQEDASVEQPKKKVSVKQIDADAAGKNVASPTATRAKKRTTGSKKNAAVGYRAGQELTREQIGRELEFDEIADLTGSLVIMDKSTPLGECYRVVSVDKITLSASGMRLLTYTDRNITNIVNEMFFDKQKKYPARAFAFK